MNLLPNQAWAIELAAKPSLGLTGDSRTTDNDIHFNLDAKLIVLVMIEQSHDALITHPEHNINNKLNKTPVSHSVSVTARCIF